MKKYELCFNDRIMGILGLSDGNHPYRLLVSEIYKAFYEIYQKSERFRKQTSIYFSIKGDNVYSRQIEEALFSMGTAGLKETIGPSFNKCIIHKKEIRNYFKKILSPEDFSWLCELANEFKKITKKFADETALSK